MKSTVSPQRGQWPKAFDPLTPEQQLVSDDFMHHWHEVLPARFGLIESFNHKYPARSLAQYDGGLSRIRTVEIGAGSGSHLSWEDLSRQDYYCIELRQNMADSLSERFPGVEAIVGDCQERLPFESASVDRCVAIHVLEHLPRLPDAIHEIYRILKVGGSFSVVIPCDPGFMYGMARRVSAQRIFEKRYGQSYDWFIQREHINAPFEILEELAKAGFALNDHVYFPFRIPIRDLNLVLGVTGIKT